MLYQIFEKKTVVVTGAAGFIGSHLTEYLLSLGAKVIGIDNFSLGTHDNIKIFTNNSNFQLLAEDIVSGYDRILLKLKSENINEIWHLAANSDISSGVANPDIDLRDTFLTTHNMLKLASELKVKSFIFASTSAVYGDMGENEIFEDQGPLFPISNYGAMKLASEASISASVESFLKNAWIFRFPNVVGSKATHGIIYDFLKKIKKTPDTLHVLGDGKQQKQYLHVSELIDAMLFVRSHANEKLNYFNLGVSSSSTMVNQIVNMVLKSLKSNAEIHYSGGNKGWVGDVPKFKFSTKKLNSLGWSPSMTSNQAVERAIQEIVKELGII